MDSETNSLIRKFDPALPDLNQCDFFLWNYLKSRVFNQLAINLNEMKVDVTREKNVLKNTFS